MYEGDPTLVLGWSFICLMFSLIMVLNAPNPAPNPADGDYDIELNKNHISYEESDFGRYYLAIEYHIDCTGNGDVDVAESSISNLDSLTISDVSEACTDDQQSFDREDYYVWTDTAFNEGDKV